MFPKHVQHFISNYQILGIIPLDKVLHVVIGAIITICLRAFKFRLRYVGLVLGGLCVVKEVIDLNTLNSSVIESIMDTLATFVYPVLLAGAMWLKARTNRENEVLRR
jgi:hypothetical protein